MKPNVFPFQMNDVSLQRKIAELACDSANVSLSAHAKIQMKKRKILFTQILYCLRKGNVVEPAHLDIYGCWKCTLEALISGDVVKVATALDKDQNGDFVVVVTVMH